MSDRNLKRILFLSGVLLSPVGHAADARDGGPSEPESFRRLLATDERVTAVFVKALTKNDDSGRHGVLVPTLAWSFFPRFPDFDPLADENRTLPIRTVWPIGDRSQGVASNWKHYHRYPERRLTALKSRKLNDAPEKSLLLVGCLDAGESSSDLPRFGCRVVTPNESEYSALLERFGIKRGSVTPGWFAIQRFDDYPAERAHSPALTEFLKRFDTVSERGFVRTLRAGSTGIGYTLETLLDIAENNSPRGDFMGMELKAWRDNELTDGDSKKMNLFLKEPEWLDSLSGRERVERYGYFDDDKNRQALYSTVTATRSSHGFRLRIDRANRQVFLDFEGSDVASWSFDVLNKRLKEKLSEAVFVAARSRGAGRDEQFHYRTVVYCREPSVAAFVELIASGNVVLELRMHLPPTGSVRNHGSAFRIKQQRLPELYGMTVQVRPR